MCTISAWNKVSFLEALLDGLSRPQKAIPCAYLYDHRGMRYFDQICRLPEYYPYRTEIRILQSHAPEIAELIGADAVALRTRQRLVRENADPA